jgi:hypothetical protein
MKSVCAATALCLALGGCAFASGGAVAVGASGTPTPVTFLEIDNRHWSTVTIYAVRDGMRRRLGTAVTARTTTLRVPAHLLDGLGLLTLQAVPDGAGRGGVIERVSVTAGQRVTWTIQARLEQSSLGAW